MANSNISRRRARASLAVAVVILSVLGGATIAGAAGSSWFFPRPTTTTTTTAPAAPAAGASGSSIGCPAADNVQNLVLSSGDTYLDANSPTANVTISSSKISWKIDSPAKQTRVVSLYAKAGFVTYSGVGPSSVVTSSSSLGRLSSVLVCTTPLPSPTSSSPTSSTPSTTPSSGACPTGQIDNVVTVFGKTYLDADSPTIKFTIGSSSISWQRVGNVLLKPGIAQYQLGTSVVSSVTTSLATTSSKGKLLTLVICTTTP